MDYVDPITYSYSYSTSYQPTLSPQSWAPLTPSRKFEEMPLFLATLPLPPPLLKIPAEVEEQGKPGDLIDWGAHKLSPFPQSHKNIGPRLLSACSSLLLPLQVPKDRA